MGHCLRQKSHHFGTKRRYQSDGKAVYPGQKVLETSEVSNSSPVDEQDSALSDSFIDGALSPRWYRLLRRPTWAWRGPIPSRWSRPWRTSPWGRGAQSRTLSGHHQGYVPGNWVYEWSQLAGRYFNTGGGRCWGRGSRRGAEEPAQGSALLLHRKLPHLKHDELADQAQLLGNMAYREAGRLFKVPLKELQVPFRGKTIQGYLHLPTTEKPVPLVIVSGGIDSLQVDFLNFYFKCLEPHGIGMLSLDMPGTGYAEHWPWCRTPAACTRRCSTTSLGGGLGRSPAHRHGGVPPRRQCGGPSRLRRAVQA